jgi:hypothetical protein
MLSVAVRGGEDFGVGGVILSIIRPRTIDARMNVITRDTCLIYETCIYSC